MNAPTSEAKLVSDRHDTVLALALGVLAVGRRFEDAVSAHSSSSEPLAPEDPVVMAALGVIAVGQSLRRWLHQASTDTAASPRQASRIPIAPGELLR